MPADFASAGFFNRALLDMPLGNHLRKHLVHRKVPRQLWVKSGCQLAALAGGHQAAIHHGQGLYPRPANSPRVEKLPSWRP